MHLVYRAIVLSVAIAAVGGCYRPADAQPGQKNWKDHAEYDLYDSISKESKPARKLELLNSWKQQYPDSDFADVRRQDFLSVYSELGRPHDVLEVAGEVLAKDPNSLKALSGAVVAISAVTDPTPRELETAELAAHQALLKLDKLFARSNKPPKMSETDWGAARRNVQLYAQNALGYVAWHRKDYDTAEREFLESLSIDANQPQVSYWLSSVILAERKPEKYSAALYHMARAAVYDGPGALNEAARKQVFDNFLKTYITYHGSDEGTAKILELARITPFPPGNFNVPSRNDLLKAELDKQRDLERRNPQLALWKRIKATLVSSQGPQYFEERMKGAELPEFQGKLLGAKPLSNPTELTLSIEDGATPDAIVQLKEPLSGQMALGEVIAFKGIPRSYTASPFTVTFSAERGKISGWKTSAPAKAKAADKGGRRH